MLRYFNNFPPVPFASTSCATHPPFSNIPIIKDRRTLSFCANTAVYIDSLYQYNPTKHPEVFEMKI